MEKVTRSLCETWLENAGVSAHVCQDCDGLHFTDWETRPGVLEARCFVEDNRCSLLIEFAVRPSAVLPLQGAVHFMNFDHTYLKVMLALDDNDVPRLLLSHAIPAQDLSEKMFTIWTSQLLAEAASLYKQMEDMEVFLLDDADTDAGFDHLH